MFNPEMMKMAQDMMSKMSPEQLAQMQRQAASMMSNPEQMQQAMNMMNSMSPEDLRRTQQMAANMPPEHLASQASNFSAAMGAGQGSQQPAQYNAALQLKNEGNALHGQQRYKEAAQKYEQAVRSLEGQPSQQARDLRTSCHSNLASCFLQLGQHRCCVEECDAVLAADSANRKALYRRGQAYAALGDGEAAVRDLQKALVLSPENEKDVIRGKLREAQEKAQHQRRGVFIEEVTEQEQPQEEGTDEDMQPLLPPEGAAQPAAAAAPSAPTVAAAEREEVDGQIEDIPDEVPTPQEAVPPVVGAHTPAAAPTAAGSSSGGGFEGAGAGMGLPPGFNPQQMEQVAQMMKDNPSMMQAMAEQMRSMSDEQLAAALQQGGGGPAGITPQMARQAAEMMRGMPPEQLRAMADQARTMAGGPSGAMGGGAAAPAVTAAPPFALTPEMAAAAASNDPQAKVAAATAAIKQNPDMLKQIGQMMESMPAEQLEAMMASIPGAPAGMKVDAQQMKMAAQMMKSMSPEELERMAQMAQSMAPNLGMAGAGAAASGSGAGGGAAADGAAAAGPAAAVAPGGLPGMPAGFDPSSIPPNMMAEMRKKMEDPATMKMVQNMLKSMNPEDLAAMMSQSGMKVTPEQAKKMAESMGNMSETHLQMLAKVTSYVNWAIDAYQRARAFVLGQGMLALALAVLLLALLLRWLGWL